MMVMVGCDHKDDKAVIYVAYFQIIGAMRVERRDKGSALFHTKEDHQTLLHTKYESSEPCGFGEDFLCFSHCKSIGAICCHGNQSSNPTWAKT